MLVSHEAVLCVVTQRSSPDDTKNGCTGDYRSMPSNFLGKKGFMSSTTVSTLKDGSFLRWTNC